MAGSFGTPIAAWKNLDGSYTIRPPAWLEEFDNEWPPAQALADARAEAVQHNDWPRVRAFDAQERLRVWREEVFGLGGRHVPESGVWLVPESALDALGAYRILIVILANYCCNSASYAEVRDRDFERGKVFRVFCPTCGKRPIDSTLWEVSIVEYCGEGEEGRRTYESAFQAEIEGYSG